MALIVIAMVYLIHKLDEWFPSPEEYTPGFTKEKWLELLNNKNIIGPVWGGVLAAFYEARGAATCTQIAKNYNTIAPSISGMCTALARRIHKETQCPLYEDQNEKKRYWTIMFQGKAAATKAEGVFIWKLRQELYDALTEFDIMRYRWKSGDLGEPYTPTDLLNEVFMTDEEYNKLAGLLRNKKNVILQGAPGVGKTFTAKRLAYSIMGEKDPSRVAFVQFHQSYSYEDFIMGYRPAESGDFKLTNGVFYEFCKTAADDPDRDYFFIIDEINRGNLSKIFGELLMLIESDKRGPDHSIDLVYGARDFYVPENLYIIGMMNTADRSLAMIDYALRRRFGFYSMKPAFENAGKNGFADYMAKVYCDLYKSAVAQVVSLDQTIRKELGEGFEIGHSYFSPENESVINDDWVRNVIEFELLPLIDEYCFDDKEKGGNWSAGLRGLLVK